MNRMIQIGDLGVGGQRGRIFSTHGIIACVSATDWKDAQKILIRRKINDCESDFTDREHNNSQA